MSIEKAMGKSESREVLDPNFAFKVKFNVYTKLVAVEDVYCTNPHCGCRDITLKFYEINDRYLGGELFDITFDIDTWDIKEKKIHRNDLRCEEMIQEFITDLDDDSKAKLLKRFEMGKKFDGANLREDLNRYLLRQGPVMNYIEVFEDKEYHRFIFEYNEIKYRVLDHYCTNPKCKCNDAILVFYEYDDIADINDAEFSFTVRLSFKNGRYEVEDKKDGLSLREIKDIYEQFIYNLDTINFKILKDRYKRMKKAATVINDNAYKTKASDANRIENDRRKVGRNDPCPCGSGKKYKKCCGR